MDCLQQAGAITVPVPIDVTGPGLQRVLNLLDGFVYADASDFAWGAVEASERDEPDDPRVGLVREIAARRLPLLGFGAGIQVLNVATGGSLRELPAGSAASRRHIYAHNPRHTLMLRPGTLASRLFDNESLVTSWHQAVIDEVAVGLVATASSPDGIVEVLESETDDWLAMGLQFVPQTDATSPDLQLFCLFLEQIHSRAGGTPRQLETVG